MNALDASAANAPRHRLHLAPLEVAVAVVHVPAAEVDRDHLGADVGLDQVGGVLQRGGEVGRRPVGGVRDGRRVRRGADRPSDRDRRQRGAGGDRRAGRVGRPTSSGAGCAGGRPSRRRSRRARCRRARWWPPSASAPRRGWAGSHCRGGRRRPRSRLGVEPDHPVDPALPERRAGVGVLDQLHRREVRAVRLLHADGLHGGQLAGVPQPLQRRQLGVQPEHRVLGDQRRPRVRRSSAVPCSTPGRRAARPCRARRSRRGS